MSYTNQQREFKVFKNRIQMEEEIFIAAKLGKVYCNGHGLNEMNKFPVFDEHIEFECEQCGKNVKIPEYIFKGN